MRNIWKRISDAYERILLFFYRKRAVFLISAEALALAALLYARLFGWTDWGSLALPALVILAPPLVFLSAVPPLPAKYRGSRIGSPEGRFYQVGRF